MSAFISYSRANSDFAVRLAKDLKSAGYDIWLDQLDIQTGARWDDEIEIALEACTTFMIILSPESMQSQNVKDEIGYAIDAGKDILPVKLKSGDMPFRLKRFQYVDFTDRPYEKSLKEIKSLLAMTGQLASAKLAQKNPDEAEAQLVTQKVQPVRSAPSAQAKKPSAKKPEAIRSPVVKTPMSRGLIIGMVAVVPLVIAAIIISAIRANNAPVATPTTGAPVVENSLTEQLNSNPTPDTTQVSAQTQVGQPEIFLTKFLDSKDLENWENIVKGKISQVTTQSNEGLVFNLDDRDLHAYYFYKPVIYEDVIIRMKAENLGQNNNTVSLVCRRMGDNWYEFSITASSLWQLYDYRGEYDRLDNGGTRFGNSGKAINEYEMRCIGDEISLYVNGQLVETFNIIPPRNRYPKGQVGLGVSSEDVFPIDIKVIEFEVSKP